MKTKKEIVFCTAGIFISILCAVIGVRLVSTSGFGTFHKVLGNIVFLLCPLLTGWMAYNLSIKD